jgi:alpha-mannosidase
MLDTCASNPEFKFSYETTAALLAFLERKPERTDEMRALLKAGRLDIGGLFVSANADACSEEAIARNFYFGKKWLEDVLGYSPTIAKEYDPPGHTLQMPQLIRSSGMEALAISRGPQGVFSWLAPDGSEILTCCVRYNQSYWRKLGVSYEETEKNLPAELERAATMYAGPDLLILDGDDMTLPNPRLPEIVEQWNQNYDRPKLALSTLEDYVRRVRRRGLPHRSGDMPNLWAGIHSLQVDTIRDVKTLQNLLPFTEALHTFLGVQKQSFERYPIEKIDSCWRRILLVADHNWGGKDETRHGPEGDEYKRALALETLRECRKLIEQAFDGLSKALLSEESTAEMPVLVFNSLSGERTDVASIEISCDIPGLEGIEVANHKEEVIPFGTTVLERHSDDTILRARADFLCRDLPSLGYSTYYIKPIVNRQDGEASTQPGARVMENEYYRIELSEDGSSIESLYDKDLSFELAGKFPTSVGPFEFEFRMFELFGIGLQLTIPDQSFFENPENEGTGESVSPTGEIWHASDHPTETTLERNGTLSQSLVMEGEFAGSRRIQRIVLHSEIKRVDLHVELDWKGTPNAALYLQMPNTLMDGQMYMDVPFAVHRDGNELTDFWLDEDSPLKFKLRGIQDWLCFEKGGRGLAVATRWPVIDYTIVPAFTLMWTNDNSGFFIGERYRQVGKHSFSFSLTSYAGEWRENKMHLWGRQWARPLCTFFGEAKPVEAQHSYLSVDSDNVVVSAVKKAHDEDAIVIRLYEVAGQKTETRLRTPFTIRQARTTNLIETAARKLASQGDSVKLSFRPFEIKTIKLYLQR